jgi:release factor glutamine methyltransferase
VEDELVARLRAAGCVFAEDEAALLREAASGEALEALVARRVAGEPLEPLLGWAAFAGLRVAVAPGVFVPRVRSELLVDAALDRLPDDAVVVELCCGVGAIGAAVRAARPDAEVWASDIDPDAVAVARRNLPAERVREGDLYAALPDGLRGRVDLLVANAPYVPSDEIAFMPAEARDHEHRVALDGGTDGLEVQARIASGCLDWLAPGGRVVIETSERQAPRTASLLEERGLAVRVVHDDERDGTCVVGELGGGGLETRPLRGRSSTT